METPQEEMRIISEINLYMGFLKGMLVGFSVSERKLYKELEILAILNFVDELTDNESIDKLKGQTRGLRVIIFNMDIPQSRGNNHEALRHKLDCIKSLICIIDIYLEVLTSIKNNCNKK